MWLLCPSRTYSPEWPGHRWEFFDAQLIGVVTASAVIAPLVAVTVGTGAGEQVPPVVASPP